MSALGRAIGVRPDHRRNAAVASLILFGVMAGYAVLEATRDALFLARLPATRLPWAYLAIAASVTLSTWLWPVKRRWQAGRRRLAVTMLASAAVMLALHSLQPTGPLGVYVFYVTVGLVATALVVRVWVLVGSAFDIGAARQSFARIAAGGVLGSIAGSALAGQQLRHASPLSLVPIAAAIWVVTSIFPLLLEVAPRARSLDEPDESREASLGRIYRASYARQLFWMVVLATVATTVGDFVFKISVAEGTAPRILGARLANYQVILNGLALVIQLLVAPLLLRRAGANRTILTQPALTVVAALGFVAAPGIAAGLLVKGVDGALRNSLHRTSLEVLYVPLPADVRARLKTFIDGVGQRGAQAAASLLVLGALALGARPIALALGLAVGAALWLLLALGLRRHYVDIFRHQIRQGRIDERAALPPLDLQSVESLLASLNSSDDARVIATLEALAEQGKAALIPALILYHPSPEVVLRALEILDATGRSDFLPLTEKLLAHSHATVRAAALRTRAARLDDAAELERLARDVSAEVRATARVALVSRFAGARASDWAALAHLVGKGTHAARLALLQSIARLPHPSFVPLLVRLATVEDPALSVALARAIQALPDARLFPIALAMLADRDARDEARKAFLRAGDPAVAFLARALDDDTLSLHVRRHIPRTLSRFGTEPAAAILLQGLTSRDRDGVMRFKMLRGLGRMRTNAPSLRLDRATLLALARAALERSRVLGTWRHSLASAGVTGRDTFALLKALVERKERMSLERLFRYLDLLYPGEALDRVYVGLSHADAGRRASSRELLEYLLRPPLREPVMALVDDAAAHDALDLDDCLDALSADHSRALHTLANEYREELRTEEYQLASL